ncbi:hypothetical protein UFOVP75_177 [uncultured Caudovirales phage]|uniref:Uncharacterized protein n=1 Tax=uncultured Caudovirales phage TaxID=2100421 RepID=A0A6J5L684_9CAUD|nr:hypothetical protein UFOVP75_177 [uncultured Caudovirales phage]
MAFNKFEVQRGDGHISFVALQDHPEFFYEEGDVVLDLKDDFAIERIYGLIDNDIAPQLIHIASAVKNHDLGKGTAGFLAMRLCRGAIEHAYKMLEQAGSPDDELKEFAVDLFEDMAHLAMRKFPWTSDLEIVDQKEGE